MYGSTLLGPAGFSDRLELPDKLINDQRSTMSDDVAALSTYQEIFRITLPAILLNGASPTTLFG